jgi:toxin HigB-1
MLNMIFMLDIHRRKPNIMLNMIRSFADAATETFWKAGKSANWPPADIRNSARRKLAMLDAATRLEYLQTPPGNRLHELERDRKGRHSISINKQFRICFRWHEGDAYDVEIVDYH